jgi:hypothetical protein
MAIVNGSLELGYKNTAWFTANPTLVLKEGQIVYLEQTGTYKIGNGVSTLSALSFLGVSSETQTLQNVTDLGSTTTNSITANGFVKTGGTASQFLKANGSVDSTTYLSTQVVPVGGTTGQILAKIDDTDYNLEWIENYANYTSVLKHTVKASVALTKGQAVYVSGASGTNMLVSKASNASEPTSSKTLGLIAQDLAINGQGFVITEGLLSNINTNSATIGDPVWLGVDGALIYGLVNKPYAPAHLVFIGIVTRVSATVGEIFVKVQNGFELNEIHDVDLKTNLPNNNEILTFESSTSLWKPKTVVSALGFTPYNATNPSAYISGITSGMVTTALGFTPYNSTNPSGYITGITSGMVTTALGFTPYNSTNPSGYITSSALTGLVPYTGATANLNLGTRTLTTPTINGVSGLLSFGSTDRVNVGNYATPSAQRMLTVGQDTAWTSIGSMIGATGSSAIYMNVATPSAVNYVLRSSGTNLFLNTPSASDSLILSTGGVANRFVITGTFGAASFNAFALLGASNTNQTASTAVAGWNYQSFSRQWATGAIGTQLENIWGATTYSFVGASTITNAYGNVFNAPVAGTNCTITNNYAAQFNGNVVIGSTGQLIEIKQTTNAPTIIQTGATSSNISVKSGTRSFSMINYAADANYFQTLGAKFYISTVDAQAIGFSTTNIERLTIGAGGGITVRDNNHFTFEVTNGTKFGTATNQKLSFWAATPIVQPTTSVTASTFVANTSLIANDTATFDGYTIGQVVKALRNMGLLA